VSFRDWLSATLTNFAVWLASLADGGLTALWYYAYYRQVDLDRERTNVENGVKYIFAWLPDLLSFARDFFVTLIIGYVVTPFYNVLTWPWIFIRDRIYDLWQPSSGHYRPVKYGLDVLYHVRDRLIDLVDFATSLRDQVYTAVTGLITAAYNTLAGFISGAITALNSWAAWVRDTVWAGVLGLLSSLADTNRMLTQVYNDLRAITHNPAAWVWSNIEPTLKSQVEAWLNRIWYS